MTLSSDGLKPHPRFDSMGLCPTCDKPLTRVSPPRKECPFCKGRLAVPPGEVLATQSTLDIVRFDASSSATPSSADISASVPACLPVIQATSVPPQQEMPASTCEGKDSSSEHLISSGSMRTVSQQQATMRSPLQSASPSATVPRSSCRRCGATVNGVDSYCARCTHLLRSEAGYHPSRRGNATLSAVISRAKRIAHDVSVHIRARRGLAFIIALFALLTAISVPLIAFAGYVVAGPYIAVAHIRSAIVERDAQALADNIDFPTLRSNLKEQFNALLMRNASSPEMANNPFAGFGMALATNMINGMVDNCLTPQGLANLMSGSRPQSADATSPQPLSNVRYSYDSASQFSVWAPGSNGKEVRIILTRSGFSWRLSNIVIPMD